MRSAVLLVVALVLALVLVAVPARGPQSNPSTEVRGTSVAPPEAPSPDAQIAVTSWTLLGTQSPGRDGHGFVYDSKADLFVVFGGAITTTSFTNSTWLYNYSTNQWANVTPVVGPSPRAGPGMVYDSVADRIILFGGQTGGGVSSNETWIFNLNNDTWTRRGLGPAPAARSLFGMAYDAGADRTILFGGNGAAGFLPDTWAYDYGSDAWTPLNVTSPGALAFTSMTYDSAAKRDVLFGGVSQSGITFTWHFETRSFDYANLTWTNRNPVSHPSARGATAFTYDSLASREVLFGGTNDFFVPGTIFNDTWSYDYALNTWSNVTPASSPSPRVISAMAFSDASNVTVLFGGASLTGVPLNDAWAFRFGPSLPSAPRNLLATAGVSRIDLTWLAPSSDGGSPVTNYTIYRGNASGNEALLATVGNVLTYTDTAVTEGVTYYYEVAAVTAAGEGPKSNEASATPIAPPTPPSAPQNLSATAGDGQVVLTWDPPLTNGTSAVTGYDVYRGTTSGGEALLTSLGAVLTYTDTTVTNGVTYYYKVSAVSSAGEGPKSSEVSATPTGPTTVPSAPQSLAAAAGNAQVTLTWQAPASDGGSAITGYKVYRGTSSGGETLLTSLAVVLTYTDTAASNGVTYYYEVSAVNGVGEGPKSNEASATPAAPPSAPSAPQSLAAAAGNAQVVLTWQAPSSNGGSAITGYRVYRGTSSGTETLLTSLGDVLTYTDTGLTNGQTYYYQVSAINGAGEGLKSTEVHATPSAPDTTLPMITIVSPANNSALTSTSVTVTGTASDNVAVAKVELSTDGTTWTQATGTTSWSGTLTLVAGTNTIYARATDSSGNTRTARITVTVSTVSTAPAGLDPLLLAGILIIVVVAALAVVLLLRRRRKKPEAPPPGGTP